MLWKRQHRLIHEWMRGGGRKERRAFFSYHLCARARERELFLLRSTRWRVFIPLARVTVCPPSFFFFSSLGDVFPSWTNRGGDQKYSFWILLLVTIIMWFGKKNLNEHLNFVGHILSLFLCKPVECFSVPAMIFLFSILPYSLTAYTRPHLFFLLLSFSCRLLLARSPEKEWEKGEGKKERKKKKGPLLSWTWGACHGLEVLSLPLSLSSIYLLYHHHHHHYYYYPVTLYLYIWCLVVEISSTATMPVERR